MKKNTHYKTLALLGIFAFLLGACGSATQTPDPVIATSVALTVAAQNIQQNAPTSTAIPTATIPPNITFPTSTQQLLVPTPTKPGSSTNTACAKANFVSETIPDGTIMKPGNVFTKTWQIKNDSSCTWDTTYKIVYWGGDSVMGGAYYYNLPQAIAPGGVIDISLVLTAPTEEGEFTSEWMLQTPNNIAFGVGQYNEPITAKIVISKVDKPVTAITDVKLEVIRDPAAGCATNIFYRYVAQVSANGKITIRYGFQQSDGNRAWTDNLVFDEAGTKTVTGPFWSFHLGSSPGQKWVQFVVIKPYYQEFEKQYFSYLCGNTP
ncbi:MAG: NBR1-Ig-like domain-containing protein [Anaerolineales bacterium]|nr:NBR1-Ig-like domain-containing protein [Anaerolineales bacterium]